MSVATDILGLLLWRFQGRVLFSFRLWPCFYLWVNDQLDSDDWKHIMTGERLDSVFRFYMGL